jgi:GNAT superfamily N-acetyltransferase
MENTGRLTFRNNILPGDEQEVSRIVTSTGFFNAGEISVAVELAEEALVKGRESGYEFLFAQWEDVTAGYCCFGPIPCTDNSYDLYWIAVHADFQNRGIGAALLKQAEILVDGAGGGKIFIETSSRPQYEQTRRFYLRSGYVEEAVLYDFYQTGDHRITFSKRLRLPDSS